MAQNSTKMIGAASTYSSSAGSNKVYELRTYDLVPQKVGEFMALSKEKMHLRTNHSVLLGYWTTELGGLNQVVHLWEYGSLAERAGVRAKLGGDADWQAQYFQRILPWLQKQDNLTLTSLVAPAPAAETGGAYELWQLNMKTLPQDWTGLLKKAASELQADNRSLCGLFKSEFGPMNSAVMIWRHESLDSARSLNQDLFQSEAGKDLWHHVASSESKLMSAVPFSPWK